MSSGKSDRHPLFCSDNEGAVDEAEGLPREHEQPQQPQNSDDSDCMLVRVVEVKTEEHIESEDETDVEEQPHAYNNPPPSNTWEPQAYQPTLASHASGSGALLSDNTNSARSYFSTLSFTTPSPTQMATTDLKLLLSIDPPSANAPAQPMRSNKKGTDEWHVVVAEPSCGWGEAAPVDAPELPTKRKYFDPATYKPERPPVAELAAASSSSQAPDHWPAYSILYNRGLNKQLQNKGRVPPYTVPDECAVFEILYTYQPTERSRRWPYTFDKVGRVRVIREIFGVAPVLKTGSWNGDTRFTDNRVYYLTWEVSTTLRGADGENDKSYNSGLTGQSRNQASKEKDVYGTLWTWSEEVNEQTRGRPKTDFAYVILATVGGLVQKPLEPDQMCMSGRQPDWWKTAIAAKTHPICASGRFKDSFRRSFNEGRTRNEKKLFQAGNPPTSESNSPSAQISDRPGAPRAGIAPLSSAHPDFSSFSPATSSPLVATDAERQQMDVISTRSYLPNLAHKSFVSNLDSLYDATLKRKIGDPGAEPLAKKTKTDMQNKAEAWQEDLAEVNWLKQEAKSAVTPGSNSGLNPKGLASLVIKPALENLGTNKVEVLAHASYIDMIARATTAEIAKVRTSLVDIQRSIERVQAYASQMNEMKQHLPTIRALANFSRLLKSVAPSLGPGMTQKAASQALKVIMKQADLVDLEVVTNVAGLNNLLAPGLEVRLVVPSPPTVAALAPLAEIRKERTSGEGDDDGDEPDMFGGVGE